MNLNLLAAVIGFGCLGWCPFLLAAPGGDDSRLSDERIPLMVEEVPTRPKPLIEWGEPFLGTGTLSPGFQLPTGAVWQPSLLMFGSLRTALQTRSIGVPGRPDYSEAAARLDLFTNLQLSGSERLVMGLRNLDQDGRFTSHIFDSDIPGLETGSRNELNSEIQTLFFEGDIGEIFPNLSKDDFRSTDVGFAIGRQPLFFQEGMFINDTVDGLGLTRNSLLPNGTSNLRTTFFWGWNNINRGGLARDDGTLFSVLTSVDFPRSTMDIDLAYVKGDLFEDYYVFGMSSVQRLGLINTSFRLLGSYGDDPALDGALFFTEVSWTPHHTHNHVYFTAFYTYDNFVPASTGPTAGGPLGRVGISFASVGLGVFGAPLTSGAFDNAGGAAGYQMFFNHNRRQWIIEAAANVSLNSFVSDQYAVTSRYQAALARHFVVVWDAFASHEEALDDLSYGTRLELLVKF